ncbi:uncharacterized protein LOC106166649 [Lingula anatina]|uniref:Uncharacterized protein LOC106166649 n=1 Tax=Lingula anatina TaxID=7574 RepID=A0A1S3IRQ3_LINAN|nr:uncharacterized protein LOC106166649 [Lingula anatina]|eukprot:XP_013400753.1 uncharacterized protein LOC106166649 [Lingula anatina]
MDVANVVRVFMAGDLILGRGIDQILPHPSDPTLYEAHTGTTDARSYTKQVVSKKGALPKDPSFDYIWGDALDILSEYNPDFRIINLESAVTTSDSPWLYKDILFRMHPKNVDTLKSIKVDCCVLSNNHVLDWGYSGLEETIKTLQDNGLGFVGAGKNIFEAEKPAIFGLRNGKGRIVVFGRCEKWAHVPASWAATPDRAGVCTLAMVNISEEIQLLTEQVKKVKKPGDLVILSFHWGRNWDWTVPEYQQKFARAAIDVAGVDIIYGHSSHHVKGIEVYHGKLITYGLGDLINDFEGSINRYLARLSETYHYEWNLMYFADFNQENGNVLNLKMVPTSIEKFQVRRADKDATDWLHKQMDKLCKKLGAGVERVGDELQLLIANPLVKGEL